MADFGKTGPSRLSTNWLTEGLIDFEYKRYVLLAYLQGVQTQFAQSRLYPWLTELIAHYQNLVKLQESREQMRSAFPQDLEGLDAAQLRLTYRPRLQEDELMQELEEIIAYAIPELKARLDEGRCIFDLVEEHLDIAPVGLSYITQDQGYFALAKKDAVELPVYRYSVTLFEQPGEKYRGISTTLDSWVQKSRFETWEQVKVRFLRSKDPLQLGAFFCIESRLPFPIEETLLPVAKRRFIRYLFTEARH